MQAYSLHQKGINMSDKAVAPSQYDLSLVGRSNTNTTTTLKGSLYTRLCLNMFDSLFLFILIAFCFSICAYFLNERS